MKSQEVSVDEVRRSVEFVSLENPADAIASATGTNIPPSRIPTEGFSIAYDSESRPSCFGSTIAEIAFVLITTFAIGQYAILEGILMVLSAQIQEGLHMTSAEVTWLLAGMALTSGAFLLFFGRVADLFGRRNLLIWSMGIYTVLMLVTGFSQSAIMIEIILAVVGISCAAVVPPAIGKLGAIYERPSRRKNRAFACFSAGNPVGFVVGAFMGGVVTQISSWRTSFWAIAVLYGALTAVAWFVTPKDAEQSLGGFNRATLAQMDWLGAFLAIVGIALFTAAFTIGPEGRRQQWDTPHVITMLIVGVLAMCAFLYWQSKFKDPLMPLHVWKDRNFSLLVASLCLGYYGFVGNFFWMTLGWQRAYVDSPLTVALKTLPGALGGIIMNVIAAILMHRVSNKVLFMVAAGANVAASILLSASSKSISFWALAFPWQLLSVAGGDITFCVTSVVSSLSVCPKFISNTPLVHYVITPCKSAVSSRRDLSDMYKVDYHYWPWYFDDCFYLVWW